MNYNDINNLNISEDVKRMYIDLYNITDNENINIEEFKDSMLSLANYNYYTASIDSDIINKIIDTNIPSFANFTDEEKEYLQYINYIVEDKDIFLDNSVFNYSDKYNKFNMMNQMFNDEDVTQEILENCALLSYNEMLNLLYEVYEVPEDLSNYINDNRLIRDEILSDDNLISDSYDDYEFNESTLFLKYYE